MNCSITFSEFVKSFGPLISAFFAIMIFYMTSQRDKKKDKKKRKLERKQRATYVTILANETIKASNQQLIASINNVESFKFDPIRHHPLELNTNVSLERLVKVLGEELTFLAITKLKVSDIPNGSIKLFGDFTVTIDYINALLRQIFDVIGDKTALKVKEDKEFQQSTDSLISAMNMTVRELQKGQMSKIETDFISAMIDIRTNLNKQIVQDISTFYYHLVIPLQKETQRFYHTSFSKIDELSEITKYADYSERYYNQMKIGSSKLVFELEDVNNKLRIAIDTLSRLNDTLLRALL